MISSKLYSNNNSNPSPSSSSSSSNSNSNFNSNSSHYKSQNNFSNNSELKHSIFRDPLGNYGDYSRGIYYEGRMKYLYSNSHSNSSSSHSNFGDNCEQSLEPPKDMMNNRQRHKSCIKNTKGVQLLQRLEFKRQMEVDSKSMGKKYDGKKKSQIIITTQPTNSSEWKQQCQAGCIFWVHQETGTIRSTPPDDSNILDIVSHDNNHHSKNLNTKKYDHQKNNSINSKHKNNQNSNNYNDNDNDQNDNNDDEVEATGALVYNSQEYEELLKVLG